MKSGEVSLHAAVICGHVGVVQTLLNKGAQVDCKTKVREMLFVVVETTSFNVPSLFLLFDVDIISFIPICRNFIKIV